MTEISTGRNATNGRFVAGNPGGPGRAKRETEVAILDALREAFSPVEIAQGLRRAFDLAEKQGSARGMVAALMPILEYGLGKPTIRVERIENDPIAEAIADIRQAYIDAAQAAQVAQQQQYTVIDVAPG